MIDVQMVLYVAVLFLVPAGCFAVGFATSKCSFGCCPNPSSEHMRYADCSRGFGQVAHLLFIANAMMRADDV